MNSLEGNENIDIMLVYFNDFIVPIVFLVFASVILVVLYSRKLILFKILLVTFCILKILFFISLFMNGQSLEFYIQEYINPMAHYWNGNGQHIVTYSVLLLLTVFLTKDITKENQV
jgi:hypothetical protein